jgi:hypothetical protein
VTVEEADRAELPAVENGSAPTSAAARGIGAKAVKLYAAVFPTLTLGDETIRNARLRIADLFSMNTQIRTGSRIATQVMDEPDMLLGADFFLSHRVYVARSQNKVYFSYSGGPVFTIKPHRPAPETAPSEEHASPN